MGKMTLKSYAVKHKMSMFQVVKLVKSGKVKSETVEEHGKNVVYILEEEQKTAPVANATVTTEQNGNVSESKGLLRRVDILEDEVRTLRLEIDALKRLL